VSTRPPLNIRPLLALALLPTAIVLGCASGAPPAPVRPSPEPTPALRDPMAVPWVVRHTGRPRTQTIDVQAELESRVDSAVRVDTLRSELTVRWSSPSSSLPRRFLGSIEEYRVAVGSDTATTPAILTLPLSFSAEQRTLGHQPEFVSPDAASCAGSGSALLHGARDLWLSLPDALYPGLTWADSADYVLCRDSIPLHTSVVREFRVTGALIRDSVVVVTIERRATTSFRGEGSQFGEPVSIQAAGTGALMLEVSMDGGAVVFGSGNAELRVMLIGRRRTQELTQRSRIAIRER
jgi:hypothetical protein